MLLVFTTTATEADAQKLANLAIAQRLAACVQLNPIQSVYEWQGKMEQAQEWRVLFKTSAAHYQRLQTLLQQHHPYDTPAIYAIPASHVAAPFADWVQQSLQNA